MIEKMKLFKRTTITVLALTLLVFCSSAYASDTQCWLNMGNRYPDLKNAFCGGGACTTESQAAALENWWPTSVALEGGGRQEGRTCKFLNPAPCWNSMGNRYQDLKNAFCGGGYCYNEEHAEKLKKWYPSSIALESGGRQEGRQCLSIRLDIDNQCLPFGAPPNGKTQFYPNGLKRTQNFSCNDNYVLVGSSSLSCGFKSNTNTTIVFAWNGTKPTCVASCAALTAPTGGVLGMSKGTQEGSVATYGCSIGKTLQGNSSRTCQKNGQWSGQKPTCKTDADWSDVEIYTYSNVGESNRDGSKVLLTNESGHSFSCRKKWDGTIKSCQGQIKGKRIALRNLAPDVYHIFLWG